MIEQLKTIREALVLGIKAINHLGGAREAMPLHDAMPALAQLEAMVGEQEPVHWRAVLDPEQVPQQLKNTMHVVGFREKKAAEGFVAEQIDFYGWRYTIEPLYAAPVAQQPQAEAVPVVDRVYEAAKRLVDHADFQLGGVLSAKSKARDIPSNAASKVKARHLASLRDALAKAPQQAEAVPPDVVRDAERYRWLRNESWAGYNTGKGTPSVYTVDGAGNRRMMLAEEAMDDAIDAAIAQQKGANHE